MSDYRVTIKVRNARLMRAIEAKGCGSVAAFCRENGIKAYHGVVDLISMRAAARLLSGEWRPLVMDLSAAVGLEPEELFTERQAAGLANGNTRSVEVSEQDILLLDSEELMALPAPEPSDNKWKMNLIRTWIHELTPREQEVLSRRYALDGPEETYDQIGATLNVTRERVRQIEMKALRRLMARAGQLADKQKVMDAASIINERRG